MNGAWKQFEGQVVDSQFPLVQYLGGTDSSAVFLTRLSSPQSSKAVIKLIPARTSADLQLSLWRRASKLEHPNLLRLFHIGRCRFADTDLLYVVMEYAEEDLSQILPQRALTPSEAREMLEPTLAVLAYLHGQGLVHSHIKPSNVLATADQLKLSSDTLFPAGGPRKSSRKADAYDAPEAIVSPLSTASDVWSLGMTLVEALTRQAPPLPSGIQADPIIPEALPQPFLDIVRHTLCSDAKRRWTISEISARLNPVAVAAAAGQAISPLAVPLSSVPALPAAKLPIPKSVQPVSKAQLSRPQNAAAPKQTIVFPNYAIPVAAVLLIVVAIVALPKILGHRPESSSSASTAAAPPASGSKAVQQPARPETKPVSKPATQPATQNSSAAIAKANPVEEPPRSPASSTSPAPAALRTDNFPSVNAQKSSVASPARGEVLDQILPDVSEKARATITGTVRVSVRVQVDPAGNVSAAEFDSPGPSQYFADLALKAARRWEFTPPEIDSRSVASTWLIRFEFSQSGVRANPKQTTP
jgi:TonB family protein